MNGVIKMTGFCIIISLFILLFLDIQSLTMGKEDLFNNTRLTQWSLIESSINIGDLIVNQEVSINETYVQATWVTHFNQQKHTNHEIQLLTLKTNELLGAIAVKIKTNYQLNLLQEIKESTFSSVILVERN